MWASTPSLTKDIEIGVLVYCSHVKVLVHNGSDSNFFQAQKFAAPEFNRSVTLNLQVIFGIQQ